MSNYFSPIGQQLASIASTSKQTIGAPIAPKSAEELMGISLIPGTRVLDKTTGSSGTIISGTVQHTVAAPAPPAAGAAAPSFFNLPKAGRQTILTVQLDGGGAVQRAPSDLVELPAGLNVPIASLGPPE